MTSEAAGTTMTTNQAWVTLATNDAYALGCLVLGQSLKRVNTTRQLHVIITSGVTTGMKDHLHAVFDRVSVVDVFDSGDSENLALINRPELGITFTKLHCWRLTQYNKCVFLDADTLVLHNSDELFERPELSAVPDIGWPDIFNSGVFVFTPSLDTYRALIQCALTHGSFDGGDQGLLNTFFHDWLNQGPACRLSFVYNMSSGVIYTYAAAYKKFGKDVKIVHFLGTAKPWTIAVKDGKVESKGGDCLHVAVHIQHWWTIFTEDIQKILKPEYTSLAGKRQPAAAAGGSPKSDSDHQQQVEAGNVDYLGRDSWDNIQKRLDKTLGNLS